MVRNLLSSCVQNPQYFHRKTCKIYELSLLLHESNQADKRFETENPVFITTAYSIGLPVCILRFEYGFRMELFTPQDYPAVFLWLNQFYDMLIKNYVLSMKITMPAFLNAFESGNDISTLGSMLSADNISMITKFLETRAKITYSDYLYRVCALLLHEKVIRQFGEEEHREIRYLKLFKTFDDCIFCKNFPYSFYQNNMKEIVGAAEQDRANPFNFVREKVRVCKVEIAKFKAILAPGSKEHVSMTECEKWLTDAFLNCMKLSKTTAGFPEFKISLEMTQTNPLPVIKAEKAI